MTLRNGHQRLYKPCRDCKEKFLPTSRYHRVCFKCIEKKNQLGRLKYHKTMGHELIILKKQVKGGNIGTRIKT